MSLPVRLKHGIEMALEGVNLKELGQVAEDLSNRYRQEQRDGNFHLSSELKAKAYLATRLPATYGAIHDGMAKLGQLLPRFAPRTHLDVGAGPGSALWAAKEIWSRLEEATLIEGSSDIQAEGMKLSALLDAVKVKWIHGDLSHSLSQLERADLVTLAYVLNELEPDLRLALITRLWNLTDGVLLIVEPGTTAGWQRLLIIRDHLLAMGAYVVAPCPHSETCPLAKPDWCHFSARVERSRVHRLAKDAELGYEDEKYSYLAFARSQPMPTPARILASPHRRSGLVQLKLCTQEGKLEQRSFSKRDGTLYKKVRKLDWGDVIIPE